MARIIYGLVEAPMCWAEFTLYMLMIGVIDVKLLMWPMTTREIIYVLTA